MIFGHRKCSGGYRVLIGSPEGVPPPPGKRYGSYGPRGETHQPQRGWCWRYALEAIMYDDISYVFTNKDSPWTLSMMCISKYATCLWDYALYDSCPKRSLVERAVWMRS